MFFQEPATSIFRVGSVLNINLGFNIPRLILIIILPIPIFLPTKILLMSYRLSPCGWLQNLVGNVLERATDHSSPPNAEVIGQLLTTY